jgi:hypothetical protein
VHDATIQARDAASAKCAHRILIQVGRTREPDQQSPRP